MTVTDEPTTTAEKAGRVVAIAGPVVDVEFPPDAVPAIERLSGTVRSCALRGAWDDFTDGYFGSDQKGTLNEPEPWREWNLGRSRARKVIEGFQPAPYETCVDLAAALDPTTERR